MGFRSLFTILTGFLLVACPGDTSQVEHFTTLAAPPNVTCIWNRLVEVAKWHRVQSIRDAIPIGINHRFNFEAKSAPHSIGILFGDDGSFTYRNTRWAPNLTFSELHAAQKSLVEVDELLDGRCNLGRIVGNVRETCNGKNCDRLAAMSN
jgi:hypothetical protein